MKGRRGYFVGVCLLAGILSIAIGLIGGAVAGVGSFGLLVICNA